MFSSPDTPLFKWMVVWLGVGVCAVGTTFAEPAYPGIGRAATSSEVAAWNIDVRPDFKGLPKGSGSVAQGMDIWEGKCASCHGVFGESNQTFSPLVGGTTADDIKTGHVARLMDPAYPARTTLMKASTLSTLWDYINRAMPWTAPKSLKPDEVYAVLAYLLNLGSIVPDNLVLSNENMADVQKLLPNRKGMTTAHGLWPGKTMGNGGITDVKAVACMKDCPAGVMIASALPEFARNASGNLADQNRLVGAQIGADTSRPAHAMLGQASAAAAEAAASGQAQPKVVSETENAVGLTKKFSCTACHAVDNRILGPSFREVAKKYDARPDAAQYLAGKIRSGGSGVWGSTPMPAQSLSEADAAAIGKWLASGAP